MFRTVPLSIIRSLSLYSQQWYMSYWFADSCRLQWYMSYRCADSYQQTCMYCYVYSEKLLMMGRGMSETCRVLFQKYIWEISASIWFYYMNIEYLLPNGEMSTLQEVTGSPMSSIKCHKATRTPNVTQKSSLADKIVGPNGLITVPQSCKEREF